MTHVLLEHTRASSKVITTPPPQHREQSASQHTAAPRTGEKMSTAHLDRLRDINLNSMYLGPDTIRALLRALQTRFLTRLTSNKAPTALKHIPWEFRIKTRNCFLWCEEGTGPQHAIPEGNYGLPDFLDIIHTVLKATERSEWQDLAKETEGGFLWSSAAWK